MHLFSYGLFFQINLMVVISLPENGDLVIYKYCGITKQFWISLQGGQRELTSIHPFSKISSRECLRIAISPGWRLTPSRLRKLLLWGGGQADTTRPVGAS